MTTHPERIARNEEAFRRRNEILRLHSQGQKEDLLLLCECGASACNAPIQMSVEDYESLRNDAHRFAIVRGHETSEAERVVEERARYVVVEKRGEAGEEAADRDPR